MPKRTNMSTKVAKIKPNLVKTRAYTKSMMMAKRALPHFKSFHKSARGLAPPVRKMLFAMRMTESDPRPTLDQKKIKPEPGEEKVPSPKSRAMIPTKIEIANQNKPLTKCFRSIILPTLSMERLSFELPVDRGLDVGGSPYSCPPSNRSSR